MSTTNLTPIEQKQNINDANNNSTPNQNDWVSFGISIIINLMVLFFIGIMGANFIYMTTAVNKVDNAGVSLLEKLLPTDEEHYFPQNGPLKGGSTCSASKEFSTNWNILHNVGIGKPGGWPYSMYKEDDNSNGIFQNFKNWLAKSTADCYIMDRRLLKKWLGVFASDKENKNIFSNETFQMFFAAPLMFFVFPLIILFIYYSSWFSAFKSGWGFALIGMFLCYTWVTTLAAPIIQGIQYLLLFTILPLIADYKRIKRIIGCNIKGLTLLFGLLVCSTALSFLNLTISLTMFVVYLFLVIKSFW